MKHSNRSAMRSYNPKPHFRERLAAGETLKDIELEAFAVVKNAARRLCGTTIQVCGHDLAWEMVHFDVQLIGGMAIHNGMIAEMATGEGKTLVATLPVYLNALTGKGVHVVTTSDYHSQRDSEWMGHLYKWLGLTVGCLKNMMPPHERREMYYAILPTELTLNLASIIYEITWLTHLKIWCNSKGITLLSLMRSIRS